MRASTLPKVAMHYLLTFRCSTCKDERTLSVDEAKREAPNDAIPCRCGGRKTIHDAAAIADVPMGGR